MKAKRLPIFGMSQRIIASAVLCSFAIFAFSLPLEHTCLLHVGSHVRATRGGKTNSSHEAKNSAAHVATIAVSPEVGSPHTDGVCLACAWSQSLIRQVNTIQLVVPGSTQVPWVTPSPRVAPFLKYSQAIPKRGPPASSLSA